METLFLWLHLFIGLCFLSGTCVQSSSAFPSTDHHRQYASHPSPQPAQSHSLKHTVHKEHKAPDGERATVRTVRVTCRPGSLEILIKADLFGVGVPVDSDELRLGVEGSDDCRATASSGDEYRIVVGLVDCGTKHWISKDSLVYTNLLIYSPVESPYGLIRMDEAVVPIECHYERKYSLSSSSLTPTWIPFASTQAAVEALKFDLRVMTDDWLYKRSSNVFHLGESISIEASVRVGHHVGLRVFMSNCVAALSPDMRSVPRYAFIENGCLIDSQVSRSRSHFLPRTQDHKLRLVIDAFKFHHVDVGGLYITCQLNAVPVNYAEPSYKACTFANRRWRSADGNDYSCRYCQTQAGQSLSKSGPRGFGRPDEPGAFWKSGLKTSNVWEQEARVGPVMVSVAKHKSGSLPVDEHSVLQNLSRLAPYGSRWRSGIIDRAEPEKGLLPLPTPDLVVEEDEEDQSEADFNDLEMKMLPSLPLTPDLLEEDDEFDTEINDVEKAVLPVLTSTPALVEENDEKSETDPNDVEKGPILGPTPEPEKNDDKGATDLKEETAAAPLDMADVDAELDNDSIEDLHDVSPTSQVKLDVTSLSNEATTEFNLSVSNGPKR